MKHIQVKSGEAGGAPATEGRLIRWARWYDPLVMVLTLGQGGALRRRTAELAGIRPGDRVLDVGCGTGELTLVAAARAGSQGEVVGIDASPEMVGAARAKAARKGAPVRFEVGLVEHIPFPEDYFDIALSSLMLHHLPGRLKQDGLVEVLRVLKPGGRLLVVDMRENPRGMVRALTMAMGHRALAHGSGDLPGLLQLAGFSIEKTGTLAVGVLAYAAGTKGEMGHA